MTAWAMARNASGIVPAVIVRSSNAPNSGSWVIRQIKRIASSPATPAVHPCRRASRDHRLEGSGIRVIPPSNRADGGHPTLRTGSA